MSELTRNPDILTCLANLSNDEVFTPPEVANAMLDLIPEDFWKDPNVRVLDPACKSGVFLREAAKRFLKGEEEAIPDLQERIDHIFHKQLFGYAITELTSHLSRRTVYCSKTANGKYSVTPFKSENGNIAFSRIEHTWEDGKCKFCGASQEVFDRGAEAETHAYKFIHLTSQQIKDLDMKFDLIIGNPPYQLEDGGAQASAKPIYHLFIEQAKKLKPRYITMIIPARWYSGGKGLDEFRHNMLSDKHITVLHDFPHTSDCFPGVNIRGGVCYFLRESKKTDDCQVINHNGAEAIFLKRPLNEFGNEIFIRYNFAVGVLKKVLEKKESSFSKFISARKPFGLATNYSDYSKTKTKEKNIKLARFGEFGYVSTKDIKENASWIDESKLFVPYASPGSDDYPHLVLSRPLIAGPKTACSETYLVVGPFENQSIAYNVATYMKTKFFRFLVLLSKSAQHITQKTYYFVPVQDFTKPYTDEELYMKYNITKEEKEGIDSLVKDVSWSDFKEGVYDV